MILSIIDILLISGVLSGFIFSLFLLLKRTRSSGLFLALILFSLSYNLLIFLVLKYRLYDEYSWLHWFPYGLNFLLGPLLFFYVKFLTNPEEKWKRSYAYHFLFVLPDFTHSMYHLIVGRVVKHEIFHYVLDRQGFIALIFIGIYLYQSSKLIKEYDEKLPRVYSTLKRKKLNWLQSLFKFLFVLFVITIFQGAIDFIYDLNFDVLEFFQLLLVVSIFWLGLNGIYQLDEKNDFKGATYFTMPEEKSSQIVERVKKITEHYKLFLDPELSLNDLQQIVQEFSSREISSALNQHLNKNFHRFINEYRVNEFKQKVLQGDTKYKTLYGIAQDSGFSSKATFNRVFKSIMNTSPREFVSSLETNS